MHKKVSIQKPFCVNTVCSTIYCHIQDQKPLKQHGFNQTTKAEQKKSINQLIIIVNCIISAFQNVILHQIWSINKESRAI